MSVKHASPVPSGPGSAEGTAFTGARTQQKSSRQPSFVSLTSISTCFPFPGWLGVCSLSQGDFLKFFRLQQFSWFQDLLSRPRSPSKSITNQTQVGGSFSTQDDVSWLGREMPANSCKHSKVSLISDAGLAAALATAVLKDLFFTLRQQVARLTSCQHSRKLLD